MTTRDNKETLREFVANLGANDVTPTYTQVKEMILYLRELDEFMHTIND